MSHRFGPRTHQGGQLATDDVANWMPASQIRSVQRATITIAAIATSGAVTINSVDVTNARLILLGFSSDGTVATVREDNCYLTFTNATTITATHDTAGAVIVASFEVIEYWPGVIRRVQRGTITIANASATNTATITAVTTAKTELDYLGSSFTATAAVDYRARIALTNSTTITATRIGTTNDVLVAYQATEWW